MSDADETLLEFPCDFPLKVMGDDNQTLRDFVQEVIAVHAPATPQDAYSEKLSRNGKFVSITILIRAESKKQLDTIYSQFSASELTKYVL